MAKAAATPRAGTHVIDTGECTLERDRFTGGWLLSINGAHSSHIDPDDPLALDFEYMRYMAALVDRHFTDRTVRLRALHLGGAACALPRYLGATYPQARQVAVELDAELARLVREWFELPRAPELRLRVGEAREVIESLQPSSRDLVVRDAFGGRPPRAPAHLTTVEFTEAVHRVLGPGGLYLANCADDRNLNLVRTEAAAVAEVFSHVVVVADAAMLKGRRTGNVVIAAADTPVGTAPELIRTLLSDPLPAQVVTPADTRVLGSGMPRYDRDVGFVNDRGPAAG